MTRRVSQALLLALLLLAVQTAILTHEHRSAAPTGAVQSCEHCVDHHAAAPAPDPAVAAVPYFHPILLLSPSARIPGARPAAAHRSRAPPVFRSA
jgi:hypothetical protein